MKEENCCKCPSKESPLIVNSNSVIKDGHICFCPCHKEENWEKEFGERFIESRYFERIKQFIHSLLKSQKEILLKISKDIYGDEYKLSRDEYDIMFKSIQEYGEWVRQETKLELLEKLLEREEKEPEYTGYCDKMGEKIYAGDWLEFIENWDGEQVWAAQVIWDDGVWTIDIGNKKQIKNSEKWSKEYPERDYVSSRAWAISVGYGEYGSWNEQRKSISEIAGYFKSSEEMFKTRDLFNNRYGKYHSNNNLERELPVLKINGEEYQYPQKLLSRSKQDTISYLKSEIAKIKANK